MDKDYTPTFRLFSRPSLLEGMARIADVFGTLNTYNRGATPWEDDAKALAADWQAIGNDFRRVLADYK